MDFNIAGFSMDYFSLRGKAALVTGGYRGMGQAFALALAKAGADVFVVDVFDTADETQSLVENEGVRFGYLQADISLRENVNKAIDGCVEALGGIDILVNNAGTMRRNPLLMSTDEDWKAVIDLDLSAVYYLSLEASRIMAKSGGGKIINVASMHAFQAGSSVSYTAAKHGVAGLTKIFAAELAEKGIQVNAIAPGWIATNLTVNTQSDPNSEAKVLSRVPAHRWGTPFDMMGAAIFLSSSASNFVTGQILAVDGGWLAS